MIKNPFSKFKILCIFVFFFVLFCVVVRAEDVSSKLLVSPHTFELKVKRGESLQDKIRILNQGEISLPISVKVVDFTAEGESGQMLFDESSQDPSFASRFWFKIENPDFILDPGEVEKVRFTIEVPENAEPGGKYTVVLFEPQLPSFYFKEGQMRTVPVIGVLFLFSVEVEGLKRTQEPFTIVEFNIPENFHLQKLESILASVFGLFSEAQAAQKPIFSIVEASHLPFTLRIKNNDIFHRKTEGTLTILKSNKKILGETEIPQTTILPGNVRRFPLEFKPELPYNLEKYLPPKVLGFIVQNFWLGKYKAQLFLTSQDDIIKEEIEFWIFPWKFWLFTALFLVFLILFVIKYRQRIKRATKALFKPGFHININQSSKVEKQKGKKIK